MAGGLASVVVLSCLFALASAQAADPSDLTVLAGTWEGKLEVRVTRSATRAADPARTLVIERIEGTAASGKWITTGGTPRPVKITITPAADGKHAITFVTPGEGGGEATLRLSGDGKALTGTVREKGGRGLDQAIALSRRE